MASAVNWFDIPAADIKRAKAFYDAILSIQLDVQDTPMGETAMFPADWQHGEIGGAISQGDNRTPSATGSLIYLNGNPDLQPVLDRIEPAGGKILMPKTAIGMDAGYFAVFTDSEVIRSGCIR
jgi:predicted enzyme related to lactoylglutathione lyase